MRPYTHQQDVIFDVFVTFSYSLAFIASAVRLYRRRKVGRLWWDDAFLFIAVLGAIWLFVLFWLKAAPADSHFATTAGPQRARAWMGLLLSWTTLWSTRISLAFGAARIFPRQHIAHRLCLMIAGLFGVILLTLDLSIVIHCSNSASWVTPPGISSIHALCNMPIGVISYSTAVAFISDVLLIAIPMTTLWNLKAPVAFRQMLISVFAASTVMTAVSIVLLVLQEVPASWEPMKSKIRLNIGYMEDSISVIVCNLVVIVSYAYRLIYGESITGSAAPTTTVTDPSKGDGLSSSSEKDTAGARTGKTDESNGTSINRGANSYLSFTDIESSAGNTSGSARKESGESKESQNPWSTYNPETMGY